MGCTGPRTVSPLGTDCLFMLFAFAAAIIYVLASSFLDARSDGTYELRYQGGSSGRTDDATNNIAVLRQGTTNMRDNVTLVSLPDQPDRMVLLLLSIVASNGEISQPLSDAIVRCLATASETATTSWGPFGLERFAPNLVQVEYFVITSEEGSLVAPGKVDEFIRDGKLTECVRASNVGLAGNGSLLAGRTVIAAESGSIVSSSGQAPGWAVGVVIGCVVGIGFIALCVLWWKGEKIYKEEDYDEYEDDESVDDGDMSASEDGELRSINVVEMIAGQHRGGVVPVSHM